ncbi:CPK3 [Symbiodinium natans]|uniref:CPK3 protein n=1 Tax=Symbiodinium natans TaxID=878477 RepID=A0A812SBK0_9DINO|nr:CPK3 [Symbiodinium natans]
MVTDASLARNERGPYGRGRAGRPGDAVVAEKCPFCLWDLQKWWPHIRAPVFLGGPAHGAADGAEVRETISEVRLCHLKCAEESLEARGGPGGGRGVKIEADFASSLRELLLRSPNLFARRAAARVSLEEERLQEVARSDEAPRWPFRELPAPPSATFAVEGIREMRLSASPLLLKLPSEIGFARSLDTLCLISNSLTELPPEVGLLTGLTHLYLNGNFLKTLPESVCALPKLQELCLDANKIEELPEITSAQLVLLTTPGNKMKEVRLVPQLQRLEVHGNQIRTIASLGSPVLHNLVTLKVMGNQLERLPEEVAYMTNLRILSVAQNRLKSLPEGISSLQGLEWLLAYGNCLTELSSNVMSGCRGLTRLLLEDNPLKPSTTAALIEAVPRSSVKTLGLDTQQVREALAASPSVCKEELPAAISVGTMLPVRGSSQISLKLTRASQLRRQAGVKSVAEPGGPVDPALQPAQLLIVAFAASQGEPEWLGFLRRLLEHGQVSPLPPACMSLSDLLEAPSASDFDEKMSRFWHGSPCGTPEAEEEQDCECQVAQLLDFDVLTAIDHRMRWYSEDRPSLQEAFRELRPRYSKMLFVGASMGGFAALLHGGVLADGVLALNPQATLPEALLRPPAETPGDLQDLTQSLLDSAKAAADRGAQITVPHTRSPRFPEPELPELGGMKFGSSVRQKLEKQWQQLPLPLKESAYKTVDTFLKHTGRESSNTRVLFRKHATGKDVHGQPVLDLPGATAMVSELSETLKIPDNFFYDLETQFYQFDFDGDARLNQEETTCMVRGILKQRRAGAGGKPEDDDAQVPYKTTREAGYSVVRELGRGGQGVMYLATKQASSGFLMCRDDDEKEYCIKFYSKKEGHAGSIHELVDEFSRMRQFNSEFVAKTYETFQDLDFYYLVNEPYFGGDWTKLAHKAHAQGVDMTEGWWRDLFRQCLVGLDYLHKSAQMHCDIKEPNLMIKDAGDYRSPRMVYIDFGLSQAFAKKLQNISGTPGYIPPETWNESVWYPQGDIFSLGVVFFQMLAGRVPSSDGVHKGIFQEGADLKQVAQFTMQSPPPWQQFPQQWRQLGGIVAAMLQKERTLRPRAAALLTDPWFDSTSAAPLPRENLARMVGLSREAVCRSDLTNDLCEKCNLRDLRALRTRLDEVASHAGTLRAMQNSAVPAATFAAVVGGYGADQGVLNDFMSCIQGPLVLYDNLLQEVVKEKERRSIQLVCELFNEMDMDGNGYLSESEIRTLLQSDAFECSYEDVDDVLENMDFNHDGYVDVEEMKRAIMEDGRIARKDEADEGAKSFWNWFGFG